MSTVNTAEPKIDVVGILGHQKESSRPPCDSVFLDFSSLAAKLGTTEQWVRRNIRRTYTRDPVPHLRFGRIIRFVWDSPEMQAWIERHQAIPETQKTTVARPRGASYNEKRTGFGPNRKERMQ